MKKIVFGSLFFLLNSFPAMALSEMDISGELDVTASVWSLPTGERGNSSFNIPSLFLDVEAPLEAGNLLSVRLEGVERSSLTTQRFDVGVREAYLDVVSVFQGMKALRLGLIPQVWQEAQYQDYSYRFLGATAWAMTEKWKYLSYSDLGVSFMSQFALGEWAVSLVNGEGAQGEEEGPHKEASLFVRFMGWSSWGLSLGYVRGNYETYGADVALKERAQALLTYRSEGNWSMGLEYLHVQDPADALRDLNMVEGIDVTDLSGKAVRGQGASLHAVLHSGPKSEVLLRYDYLRPVVGEEKKDLQTAILALGYQVSEDIRAGLSVDHTRYGENFAPGARERSKLEFAAQVLF